MSEHAKHFSAFSRTVLATNFCRHFSASSHEAMRLARLPIARPAFCRYRTSRARIGIAPARSYAKVFHLVFRRLWTGAGNLSQLSQLCFKKLGQRKPNRYAVSQLSQLVPTVFNMYRKKKEAARRVWCAVRELIRATKPGLCNATVQLKRYFLAFPVAGN